MDYAIQKLRPINDGLDRIQSFVGLDFLQGYRQFEKEEAEVEEEEEGSGDDDNRQQRPKRNEGRLGRIGLLSCFLGIQWGIHFCLLCCLIPMIISSASSSVAAAGNDNDNNNNDTVTATSTSTATMTMLTKFWTWCFYITAMCTFHLLEFFVTCLYNPAVVNSDSFLVNHSKAYTAAFLLAITEFWMKFCYDLFVRFFLMGSSSNSKTLESQPQPQQKIIGSVLTIVLGVIVVVVAQIIRSWSMRTCGESFNHFIQTERKDNHRLVTHGIYKVLRHPSYVGFFYWSIGTQIVLRNWVCVVLFALAGWSFFSRRIPYEERALLRLFGDEYFDYAARTYIGIPCISTSSLYGYSHHDKNDGINNRDNNKSESQEGQGQEMELIESNTIPDDTDTKKKK